MAAPKGNQYAKGSENNGRPRKYEPEEFNNKFKDYIEYCISHNKLLPNIAGFCYFADIHRDTFYEYKNNHNDFADTIKRIEVALEDLALNCKDPAKSIFYLKNKFGYKDKQEVETTNKNASEALTDEELEKKLADLGYKR